MFMVGPAVGFSIKDSSKKIVICEVLLLLDKDILILWQGKTAKTLKFT